MQRGSNARFQSSQGWPCDLKVVTLSDKRLAGVQKDLATLHDHALDGQVLPDVLGLAHLIVHYSVDEETPIIAVSYVQDPSLNCDETSRLQYEEHSPHIITLDLKAASYTVWGDLQIPWELLQLGFGIIQAVSLYVFMRRVGQEFVKREDVTGNLQKTRDSTCKLRASRRCFNVTVARTRRIYLRARPLMRSGSVESKIHSDQQNLSSTQQRLQSVPAERPARKVHGSPESSRY